MGFGSYFRDLRIEKQITQKQIKINVPPDVIDAARKTNADELDAAVQKNIIPLIKLSQQEAIVRSLKDIIRNDSSIMDNTVIGYCSGYEK